jgi:hypothetical protein
MSFSENPEQDRQHHRNDNARGQGKIKLKISRFEDKITWQPAEIQFLPQWPAKAKNDENNADGDQCLCHVLSLS